MTQTDIFNGEKLKKPPSEKYAAGTYTDERGFLGRVEQCRKRGEGKRFPPAL